MTDYEAEHNLPPAGTKREGPPRRRPSLSSFFSSLQEVEVPPEGPQNSHSQPMPAAIEISIRILMDAFNTMRAEHMDGDTQLLDSMIQELGEQAENLPQQLKGMPDTFLDELDRVPKKDLKKDQSCPICTLPFLDDPYPLVVRLPCHPQHKFDLDCIRPWLKLNSTCPLDRKDLAKKKSIPIPKPKDDESEEEYDEFFA